MATSLTFTSAPFASGTLVNANNTAQTILTSDPTNHRRLYGISCFINTGAPTLTVSGTFGGTAQTFFSFTSTAASANDVFGASAGAAVFQKLKDANGVPYYNVPAGHTITAQLSSVANSTGSFMIFGETYA